MGVCAFFTILCAAAAAVSANHRFYTLVPHEGTILAEELEVGKPVNEKNKGGSPPVKVELDVETPVSLNTLFPVAGSAVASGAFGKVERAQLPAEKKAKKDATHVIKVPNWIEIHDTLTKNSMIGHTMMDCLKAAKESFGEELRAFSLMCEENSCKGVSEHIIHILGAAYDTRTEFEKNRVSAHLFPRANWRIPPAMKYLGTRACMKLKACRENVVGLVMPLCQGTYMGNIRKNPDKVEQETKKMLSTVLQALDFLAGKGLGHFDIKPPNILKCGGNYKLGDLGTVQKLHHGMFKIDAGTDGFQVPRRGKFGFAMRPAWAADVGSLALTAGFPLVGVEGGGCEAHLKNLKNAVEEKWKHKTMWKFLFSRMYQCRGFAAEITTPTKGDRRCIPDEFKCCRASPKEALSILKMTSKQIGVEEEAFTKECVRADEPTVEKWKAWWELNRKETDDALREAEMKSRGEEQEEKPKDEKQEKPKKQKKSWLKRKLGPLVPKFLKTKKKNNLKSF